MSQLNMLWRKSFQEEDKIPPSLGHDTLALSAFILSSLATSSSRKNMVKEMWESGAHTIVFHSLAIPSLTELLCR
jgi:hypothetical protein